MAILTEPVPSVVFAGAELFKADGRERTARAVALCTVVRVAVLCEWVTGRMDRAMGVLVTARLATVGGEL